jgi:pyruvate dehydrogenase E2 component (dihydrolipoamide acetyltransferase)
MVVEFKFPDVGEGIVEGEIVEWLVKEGDQVALDQPLVEVETDKAVVEIPSPCKGVILEILAQPGEIIQVGQVMIRIQEEGEVTEAPVKLAVEKAPAAPPPSEPEEKKAEEAPPAPPPKEEEERVEAPSVGVVGKLEEAEEELPPAVPTSKSAPTEAAPSKRAGLPLATPAVRRLARAQGLNLSQIKGTGEDGRITREDLLKYSEEKKLDVPRHITVAPVHVESGKFGETEHIPIRGVRRAVAKQMAKSKYTAPHVTSMDEVDATELVALREELQPKAEARGTHLTYLPFIIKAVSICLIEHPYLNSSLNDEDQEIILKKFYNIGFATDTEEGLMVPVVKNADKKDLVEIAAETRKLAESARSRTISLADIKGGTFTITDFGSLGGGFGTPIINYPEVAILGVGMVRDTPVVREGEIVVRKIMPLSLSFDHRVVDGAEAQRFLNDLVSLLEIPSELVDI